MKVTIVGAGAVGASCAEYIALKNFCSEVVLIDIKEGFAEGKSMDLMQTASLNNFDTKIIGSTNDYSFSKDSSVAVITSGIPRKPGMTREELIGINAGIVNNVTKNLLKHSPDCIIIVVSNPMDTMTYLTHKVTGLQKNRIIGMGGALDSARFKAFLSMELNISVSKIETLVLGGHGDDMVPLKNYTTVSGEPISQLIENSRLNEIIQRTRDGGAEIVKLLKTGSAFYAPGVSAVEMAYSIIFDERKLLPCCVFSSGQYKINEQFVGLPVILSSKGVEKIVDIKLTEDEHKELLESASHVKELCDLIDSFGIL